MFGIFIMQRCFMWSIKDHPWETERKTLRSVFQSHNHYPRICHRG